MTLEAWVTLTIIASVVVTLVTNRVGVDTCMMGGLTLLVLFRVLLADSGEAAADHVTSSIQGFAHPAIMLIGALFVVAAGLRQTGAIEMITGPLLGRPKSVPAAQLRLMVPVAVLSAFMNNTPIVAMYLPVVNDWAKRLRISPSKLYMPLSFAAVLGGKMTYIGTASNIVVMSLFAASFTVDANGDGVLDNLAWFESAGVTAPSDAKQFWGIAVLGIPTTVLGIAFILLTSRWLLPERRSFERVPIDSRRYQVEMRVLPDSPIVGKTIEAAGLRQLPGLFLSQIERGDEIIPAVSPDTRLEADDRLAFVGVLESVVDLRKIRGLVPETDQIEKVDAKSPQRTLVEAVVSRQSPLVGKTVRRSRFRTRFNAAIIAVHRHGEQIRAKIGDIILQPGDTLLLETNKEFARVHRASSWFYLVSDVGRSVPRHERAPIALAILALLVVAFVTGVVPNIVAAWVCALAMIVTRCVTGTEARSAVNWQVLFVIAAALGMGAAMTESGAAAEVAHGIISVCGDLPPRGMLLVLFLLTAGFAQLITNNGAAVLMFPVTMATARDVGVSPEPFIFCLMVAAGTSFISPVGYQTNLMVYGPGGYKFVDFVRLGTPLTLLVALACVLIAPLVFPF